MHGKELRRRLRRGALRGLLFSLRCVPEGWGREGCGAVGRLGHRWVARDRRLARKNLGMVFPDWSREKIDRFAVRVFEEIGRNAFDFLRYPRLSKKKKQDLFRFEGLENLSQATREGRGAIIVTAHLGCWEILAAALVERGFSLMGLARPLAEPELDRLLNEHRLRMGVRTASTRGLSLEVRRHLRGGGVLGVLADQRVREGAVEVKFLGIPTLMTEAPARLASAAGVPLVPLGIRREEDHRHRITVLPPIEPGPREETRETTQKVAFALESLIRKAPEQWMWIHPRWERRVPEAPAAPRKEREEICVSS